MSYRISLVALIVGGLLGEVGTCPAEAQSRATLENLLDTTAATLTRPPEPSAKSEKPMPEKAAVDEASALVREAYEEDLKAINEKPEQVVAKLIAAANSTADPAQKCAILLVAEKAAVEANNRGLAIRAFDTRATAFMFDDAQERLVLLETLQKRSAPVDEGVFRYVVQVAQQALDADQHEQAEKAAGLASAAAKAIDRAEKAMAAEAKRKRRQPPEPIAPSLVEEATALQKTVREQMVLAAAYAVAKEKLAANPDDAESADVVGRHLCFVKGNWKEGLAALAKGKSEALKSLAAHELMLLRTADPAPRSLFALAGDWWKVAESKNESLPETHAAVIKEHAAEIYASLRGKLSSPLEIAVMEKRIASQAQSAIDGDAKGRKMDAKVVNLLPLIDPARDTVSGRWELTPAGLRSDGSDPAKLRVSYPLPAEYDFSVEFTRVAGRGDVVQMCSAAGRAFGWVMAGGPEGKFFGFANVDGRGFSNNRTTVVMEGGVATGQRYVAKVRVRKNGVAAMINGTGISSLETDYANVTADRGWSVAVGGVGVGSWRSPTIFHKIEIVPVRK